MERHFDHRDGALYLVPMAVVGVPAANKRGIGRTADFFVLCVQ